MANTPRHGKSAFFSINAAASTTKLSTASNDISFPRSVETAEISAFGDSDKKYLAGLRDATISVSGNWTSTKDIAITGLLGGTMNYVYGPESSASGREKKSGAGLITSYSGQSPIGDKVSFSMTIQCSGAVTSTNF